ncbi:hypothetical protein [Tautonia plasticadhaerens]|uniref:Uncharacterized protein n=1 Tax=Tautonia plasticadhaerens TaxID=2527974 RepID=A0A518H3C3_9BACT|nr:hypothetical protein [Tautonia plasticadhaerens]QDV35327.1 hypothetical protein ElP_32300 [Tautonia plasticadhaerens]
MDDEPEPRGRIAYIVAYRTMRRRIDQGGPLSENRKGRRIVERACVALDDVASRYVLMGCEDALQGRPPRW